MMELTDKTVIILVENLYNDHEFWYPFYRLKEAGAHVIVVGPEAGVSYTSKLGQSVTSDMNPEKVSVDAAHGLVIPGGYAPDMMRRHPSMVNLVQQFDKAGKVVAAICHAGWMLASAKILKGRTVTSFFAIKDDLVHAGADWVDQEVVVSGNLITSRTPDDLPAFLRAIIGAI